MNHYEELIKLCKSLKGIDLDLPLSDVTKQILNDIYSKATELPSFKNVSVESITCPVCHINVPLSIKECDFDVKGKEFKSPAFGYECEKCGEDFTTTESDTFTMLLIKFHSEKLEGMSPDFECKYNANERKFQEIQFKGLGISDQQSFEQQVNTAIALAWESMELRKKVEAMSLTAPKMCMSKLRSLLNAYDGEEISISKFLEEINNHFKEQPIDGSPKWIKASERLPEINKNVIGYRPQAHTYGDDIITILKYKGGDYTDLNGFPHGFERNHHVTHWMPLPEPPTTNKENGL